MISKLEQRIITVLLDNLALKLSIHQISHELKTSYAHVYNKINQLVKQQLILTEKIGNALICKLNLQNDLLRNIVGHAELLKRDTYLKKYKKYQELSENLKSLLPSFIDTVFIIKGKLGVCLKNQFQEQHVRDQLKNKTNGLELFFFDRNSFAQYLTPQIVSEKIIIHNPETYYQIYASLLKQQENFL